MTSIVPLEGNTCGDCPALLHLKSALADGKHWFVALLESMALWEKSEDEWNGCRYRYLIGGEAFDWMRLAERLCEAVDGLVPEDDRTALLFHGISPIAISPREMRRLLGGPKYRAYLNYLYGVIVEEALQQAVRAEVEKERSHWAAARDTAITDEVYRRLYGATFSQLFAEFRGDIISERLELADLKEFTYWLFKHRLRHCDPARVASDTRKGIIHLQQRRQGQPGTDLAPFAGL